MSVVEYDGYLTTGAAVFSPTLQFDRPTLSLGAQGSWTVFESGNQILQGTAAGAWLTPPRGPWRLELGGAAGAANYADEPATGYVLGRTRLHVASERTGGWIGGSTGGSFGPSDRVPFELAVAGWTVRGRVALVGTVAGTWLGDDRHLDLLGAARWTGDRVTLEAKAGARPWVRSEGGVGEARTGVYGEMSITMRIGERVALELNGGTYPSDPARQVLGANYITAGVRWRVVGSPGSPGRGFAGSVTRTARAESAEISPARLAIARERSLLRLQVHVAGATSVELRGDFTSWEPMLLTQVGPAVWEVALPVASGVHRVSVRVSGGPWLVPAGTRFERTEFGDTVGVIVVP